MQVVRLACPKRKMVDIDYQAFRRPSQKLPKNQFFFFFFNHKSGFLEHVCLCVYVQLNSAVLAPLSGCTSGLFPLCSLNIEHGESQHKLYTSDILNDPQIPALFCKVSLPTLLKLPPPLPSNSVLYFLLFT